MRLIDADDLKRYINDTDCCDKCKDKHSCCNDDCELPDYLTTQWERVIDEQPTVECFIHKHTLKCVSTIMIALENHYKKIYGGQIIEMYGEIFDDLLEYIKSSTGEEDE